MRPADARDTVFTRVFAVVERLNKCLFLINFFLHGNRISLSILYFVLNVEGSSTRTIPFVIERRHTATDL